MGETSEVTEDQPRPAFGRRPWLALDRRARNLRRFFFAMGDERVPGQWVGPTKAGLLVLKGDAWVSGPLRVADSFFARGVGMMRPKRDVGLLLHASAVHGMWGPDLTVVGLSADGTVIDVRPLRRWSWHRVAGASWIAELPIGHPVPLLGKTLVPALLP